MQGSQVAEGRPIDPLPPDVDWSVFGDELAAVLKQAYSLGLALDLPTIAKNLRDGRFSPEHYIKLYSDRVWRATHKDEVAAMEAQQRAAQQEELLRYEQAVASGVQPEVDITGQTVMSCHVGGVRFTVFYWAIYLSLIAIGAPMLSVFVCDKRTQAL